MFWETSQNSLENIYDRVAGQRLYLKRDSGKGVFLWILQNILEHSLFLKNASDINACINTCINTCFCKNACNCNSALLVQILSIRHVSAELQAQWKQKVVIATFFNILNNISIKCCSITFWLFRKFLLFFLFFLFCCFVAAYELTTGAIFILN